MALSEVWNKAAPPSGYDGACFARGNYLTASARDGKYRLTWSILRRENDGPFEPLPDCHPFTQAFALRQAEQRDVEQALRWAEKQIALFRARKEVTESSIE
jgi:hypothetical protein